MDKRKDRISILSDERIEEVLERFSSLFSGATYEDVSYGLGEFCAFVERVRKEAQDEGLEDYNLKELTDYYCKTNSEHVLDLGLDSYTLYEFYRGLN